MKLSYIIHSVDLLTEAVLLETELDTKCYIPGRDNFHNRTECYIRLNRAKMAEAIKVYLVWDGYNQSEVFDLGMSYMLYKPIQIVKVKHKHWTWTEYLNDIKGRWLR